MVERSRAIQIGYAANEDDYRDAVRTCFGLLLAAHPGAAASRNGDNTFPLHVESLLRERTDAKRARNFDVADAIRDQLMEEYSVGVDDREQSWRTGCSKSGSGGRSYGGGRGRDSPDRGRGRNSRKNFGPNGHDYDMSSDAGESKSPLSENDIHGLIAKRLQAKLSRNFDDADQIQYELIDNNVYVHDGMKEWRSDGVPFEGAMAKRSGRPGRGSSYEKSALSKDVDGATDQIIQGLIEERSKLKSIREYDKADSIREGLKSKFDIIIDDKLKEWSVGGDFGEENNMQREMSYSMRQRPYAMSTHSADLSPEQEAFVIDKVEERAEAKRNKDYDVADDIRDELFEGLGVTINDKIKQWSVGGSFGEDTDRQGRVQTSSYTQYGGGNLSEDDIRTVNTLIGDRVKAKKNRDYDTADDLREYLTSKFNIYIDDKKKEWRVDTDEYTQRERSIGDNKLTPEQIEYVEKKIVERHVCKSNRDYEEADVIRDELKFDYSVFIDDRNKQWNYVPNEADENTPQSPTISEESKELDQDEEVSEESNETEFLNDLLADEVSADVGAEEAVESGDVLSTNDAEDEAISSQLSREDLTALTVVKLKEILRERGLMVSGTKAKLIERLLA